jgi:hypothetical protein
MFPLEMEKRGVSIVDNISFSKTDSARRSWSVICSAVSYSSWEPVALYRYIGCYFVEVSLASGLISEKSIFSELTIRSRNERNRGVFIGDGVLLLRKRVNRSWSVIGYCGVM